MCFLIWEVEPSCSDLKACCSFRMKPYSICCTTMELETSVTRHGKIQSFKISTTTESAGCPYLFFIPKDKIAKWMFPRSQIERLKLCLEPWCGTCIVPKLGKNKCSLSLMSSIKSPSLRSISPRYRHPFWMLV